VESGGLGGNLSGLVLGFLAAFVTGYACIRFLLNYVRHRNLSVFAIYCWLAGLLAVVVSLVR
jgi:undecaprenyl-diphosphatase